MNITNTFRTWMVVLAILSISYTATANDKPYKGKIRVSSQELRQDGDSLRISFMLDAVGVKVPLLRSISVVPMLIGKDSCTHMPTISIKGRANYKVYRRQKKLSIPSTTETTAPYAVVKGYKASGTKQVEYRQTVAFEPWMKDAGIVIGEDLCGCGLPPQRYEVSPILASVQLESQPQPVAPMQIFPYVSYVTPQSESKKGEMASEAAIDFIVSKINIKPEYMNNPTVLSNICEMVQTLRDKPYIIVRDISVIGYASPEGTLAFNRKLSEGRAKALVNHLVPLFDYPKELYHVEFGGENWSGLRTMVEQSDKYYKNEVVSIIDSPANINRKSALFALENGDIYRDLMSKFCPYLRKAICKINYDIKPLDVKTAESLLATRPQDLNLYEIYQVAQTYGEGSPKFAELVATSVNMFPQDPTANLNAALVALAAKDIETAQRYLNNARKDCPEYENAMGVLLILKDDYNGAVVHLAKAAQAGLAVAKTNLEELATKRGITPENTTK